jgi:hypothetical protein
MSALDQQNAIETSAFFAAIIWGLPRSFTFTRDPTGTRQDPKNKGEQPIPSYAINHIPMLAANALNLPPSSAA